MRARCKTRAVVERDGQRGGMQQSRKEEAIGREKHARHGERGKGRVVHGRKATCSLLAFQLVCKAEPLPDAALTGWSSNPACSRVAVLSQSAARSTLALKAPFLPHKVHNYYPLPLPSALRPPVHASPGSAHGRGAFDLT